MQIKTLSVRVKDKHSKILSEYAFAVNQVWNEINCITYEAYNIPVPEVGYINCQPKYIETSVFRVAVSSVDQNPYIIFRYFYLIH